MDEKSSPDDGRNGGQMRQRGRGRELGAAEGVLHRVCRATHRVRVPARGENTRKLSCVDGEDRQEGGRPGERRAS